MLLFVSLVVYYSDIIYDYTLLKVRRLMNYKLGRIWKELVVQ